jgi:hypothetical protein
MESKCSLQVSPVSDTKPDRNENLPERLKRRLEIFDEIVAR